MAATKIKISLKIGLVIKFALWDMNGEFERGRDQFCKLFHKKSQKPPSKSQFLSDHCQFRIR
jgi:hypothetical protein